MNEISGREASPGIGRPRVVVLDPIHRASLEQLEPTCEVVVELQPAPARLRALVADAHAVVVRSGVQLTAEVFDNAPRLRVVARAGAGTDNIDLEAARRAGITVFNVPGRSGGAVAELAIGLMIGVMRNIALADRQMRDGLWNKSTLAGASLEGRALGLVGCGGIGDRIAQLATAFGMRVSVVVGRPTPQRREALEDRGIGLVDLDTLLAGSDVVGLAVPLSAETRGLIGAEQLGRMRQGSYLVNISRGGVVDEPALLEALRGGHLAGAALDVHASERGTSPFAGLDNVVLTPHIGAMSRDVQRDIGQTVARSVLDVLAGRPIENRVC